MTCKRRVAHRPNDPVPRALLLVNARRTTGREPGIF